MLVGIGVQLVGLGCLDVVCFWWGSLFSLVVLVGFFEWNNLVGRGVVPFGLFSMARLVCCGNGFGVAWATSSSILVAVAVELLNVYLSKGCVLPIRRLLLSLHWTATASALSPQ